MDGVAYLPHILYIHTHTSITTQLLQFNLAEASKISSLNSKSGNMNHRHIGLTNRQKLATDCNGITKRRTLHLLPHKRTSRFLRVRRSDLLRKNARNATRELAGKIRAGIKRLREEMAEISEEQKCIREGQKLVRDKFEKMEAEREQLRKETELISKQNAGIQVRLGLMSGIMKARAQNDFDLAAQLTHSLRDLLAKQDEQMN